MDEKTTPVTKYGLHDRDTGSSRVQVALLTERINHLTDHFRVLVKYRQLIEELGLRH